MPGAQQIKTEVAEVGGKKEILQKMFTKKYLKKYNQSFQTDNIPDL